MAQSWMYGLFEGGVKSNEQGSMMVDQRAEESRRMISMLGLWKGFNASTTTSRYTVLTYCLKDFSFPRLEMSLSLKILPESPWWLSCLLLKHDEHVRLIWARKSDEDK